MSASSSDYGKCASSGPSLMMARGDVMAGELQVETAAPVNEAPCAECASASTMGRHSRSEKAALASKLRKTCASSAPL